MTEGEVDRLPDPELFRDALFLAGSPFPGSPRDLDDTDASLYALVQMIRNARRRQ